MQNNTTSELDSKRSERGLFQNKFMYEIDQRDISERPVYILQDG